MLWFSFTSLLNSLANVGLLSLFLQTLAEFERILGLNTSIFDTFTANIKQVANAIVKVAQEHKGKNKEEIKKFINYIEDELKEETSPSEGNSLINLYMIIIHHREFKLLKS